MGASPLSGVVDRDGKVFGVNNLYLAGSATFPTSSQANPTLTIVALALRLAAHLHYRSRRINRVQNWATGVAGRSRLLSTKGP